MQGSGAWLPCSLVGWLHPRQSDGNGNAGKILAFIVPGDDYAHMHATSCSSPRVFFVSVDIPLAAGLVIYSMVMPSPTEPVDEGTTFVVWRRVTFDASCFSSRAFFRTISFLLTSRWLQGS